MKTLACSLVMLAWVGVASAERLPVRAYSTADGLPDNEINRIVRDSRGFLWFCTTDGLSRFDGTTFTNYTTAEGLPHEVVSDFLETRDGDLWIATNGGLVHFNPAGGMSRPDRSGARTSIEPMFSVVAPVGARTRAPEVTSLLEDRDGVLWVGTAEGLYRLQRSGRDVALVAVDIGAPRGHAAQSLVIDLQQTRDGVLWVATYTGLYRLHDARWTRFARGDGLPDENLHDLYEDSAGRLWVASRLAGVFLVSTDGSGALTISRHYSTAEGLPANWVGRIFETASHTLWLGTIRGLVEVIDAPNGTHRFRTYSARHGLSFQDPGVTALVEDNSGNLWLGTTTAGAMRIARNGFVTYGERDGFVGVNAIVEDRNGNLCFRGAVTAGDPNVMGPLSYSTRYGRFDGEAFSWFLPQGLTDNDLGWVMEEVTVQTRNGDWWLGSGVGLFQFEAIADCSLLKTARPRARYGIRDGLASPQSFRLFEDSGGAVWVSSIGSESTSGLARCRRNVARCENFDGAPNLPSLKDDLPRAFAEDTAKNVWIGFSRALVRYRNETFTTFSGAAGLPPGAVRAMLVDHAGRLWIASSRSGLLRVDNPDAATPTFRSYTTTEGLSSNRTAVLVEDRLGGIYVGTGRGLDRLDPDTGRIKHFTTADGLAAGPLRVAIRARDGALWFGTTAGLSRLVPAADPTPAPTPVFITNLFIAGSPQQLSAVGEREMELPDLAANANQLQIHFGGLAFAAGETLRFQFRLDGADGGWTAPSAERSVNYVNLAPGRYRFQVRAVSASGVASAQPATLSFRILPPVWLQGWFIGLVIGAVVSIVWLAYRFRMAYVLELANVRTRIAFDLHDDIGANLTKIAILSEVARRPLPDGTHEETVNSIARIARESTAAMSDIVWAANPKHDRVLDLVRRMRQHAEGVFAAQGIRFEFRAPAESHEVKLPVSLRRDVFLIFKEAVSNAARHARCTRVTVDLTVNTSSLQLAFADDGTGFDPSVAVDGHGLASIRHRAGSLGGTAHVTSTVGQGTSITIDLPARPLSWFRRRARYASPSAPH